MRGKKKVLILKTGYSEILDKRSNSRTVSLGDVLRSTPLLHAFSGDHVTWVTDPRALPLLEGSPLIDRILPYDFTTVIQLESEEYDTVVNLEKIPGICALADRIKARRSRFGFVFDSQTGEAEAYERAEGALAFGTDHSLKKTNERPFQELLFEVIGRDWKGEEYVLGYTPSTEERKDIALNTSVGKKWPVKAWPMENWDALEKMLQKHGHSVTRQDKQGKEILTDLNSYMGWLNSSRVIVSGDTLGMHLGIAMKKKVLGLFGPTPHREVYFYGRGKAVLCPETRDCMPCFERDCRYDVSCMQSITPERVHEAIKKIVEE